MDPGEAVAAHQPLHPPPPDRQRPAEPQLGVHPSRAVAAAGRGVHGDDRVQQVGVVQVTGRRLAAPPLRETRTGHLEHPAGHRDVQPVRGELLDQPEPYFPSTFSRANYAEARLRISFSISSTRFLRRTSTSSLCSSLLTPGLWPSSTSA